MYAALLILAAVLFGVLAWRNLTIALVVFAAALPAYLLRFSIGPFPSTLLELLFGVLFIVWVIKTGASKRIVLARDWMLPFGLLLLAGGISVIVSPDRMAALGLLKAYIIEPILLFVIVQDVIRTKDDRTKLLFGLGISALFVAMLGIAQFATQLGIPAPWDIERRITSLFPYPNAVGLYLGPIVILGLFAAFAEKNRPRIFWIVTVMLSLTAIVLAKTEAALVAIPATLFIVLIRQPKWRMKTLVASAAFLLLIALIPPIRNLAVEKLTLQDTSGQVRLAQWADTKTFLKDHALFGAGLAGYPVAIEPYHSHPEYEIFQDPHNILLNIWVELGLLGLVATFLIAKRVYASEKHDWIAMAATFALLEMVIHGLVDVPFFKNDLAMMTFLLLALATQTKTHPE